MTSPGGDWRGGKSEAGLEMAEAPGSGQKCGLEEAFAVQLSVSPERSPRGQGARFPAAGWRPGAQSLGRARLHPSALLGGSRGRQEGPLRWGERRGSPGVCSVSGAGTLGLEDRPCAHRGTPATVVVVMVVVRLRGLRGVQQWRGGLQVRGGARGLVVPRVVAQESGGRAARAGAGAAGAAAPAGRAAAPHPWRPAEVPRGWRRDGRRGTRWRSAGPRVLLGGDLAALPHLLEFGSAILEPDFDLCGKRMEGLVEEPG